MKNNVLEGFYAELLKQEIPDPDEVKKQLYLEAAFVPSKLHIPAHREHPFRPNVNTYSGAS